MEVVHDAHFDSKLTKLQFLTLAENQKIVIAIRNRRFGRPTISKTVGESRAWIIHSLTELWFFSGNPTKKVGIVYHPPPLVTHKIVNMRVTFTLTFADWC